MADHKKVPFLLLKLFRAICLSYLALSYLIICIYAAPPFTLIGHERPASFDIADWIIIVLFAFFLFNGFVARLHSISRKRREILVGFGLMAVLVGVLLVVMWMIVTARLAPDVITERHNLARSTGMLGLGWLLILYLLRGKTGIITGESKVSVPDKESGAEILRGRDCLNGIDRDDGEKRAANER